MTTSTNGVFAASAAANPRPLLAIGVGGLIVGALDLLYAIIVYSPHKPILVPQTIASGVLGAASYNDGAASAMLGTALHFFIALSAAAVFYLASRKLKFLVHHAVLCGMLYGAAVYGFMHVVVVPLSAVPKGGHTPLVYAAAEFVEHWFCVGLPIALSVRRYSP
jgi:hypothetical protein